MTLPRDLSGDELVGLLRRHYGYRIIRQRGSHARLASNFRGAEHPILPVWKIRGGQWNMAPLRAV